VYAGASAPSRSPEVKRPDAPQAGSLDIVQWAAPILYVEEDAGTLTARIMRLGSYEGVAAVRFRTVAGSALPGVNFKHTTSAALMKDGEPFAEVSIPIINDVLWAPTLEFKLELFMPTGCELGKYLHTCRVKVIDQGTFPQEKFKHDIEAGEAESINQVDLMLGFIQMMWCVRGIRWRTVLTLVMDQLKTTYLYFMLSTTIYFADVLFAENPGKVSLLPCYRTGLLASTKEGTARILGLLIFSPIVVISFWDAMQVQIDLLGHAKAFLSRSLFRKYLNYDQASRRAVSVPEIQVAMLEDSVELANAYGLVMRVALLVARIAVLVFFMLRQSPRSWWVVLLVVIGLCLYAMRHAREHTRASDLEGAARVEVVKFVHETCARYTLIAEYMQRPQVNERFSQKLVEMRELIMPRKLLEWRMECVPTILGPLLTGFFIGRRSYGRDLARGLLGDLRHLQPDRRSLLRGLHALDADERRAPGCDGLHRPFEQEHRREDIEGKLGPHAAGLARRPHGGHPVAQERHMRQLRGPRDGHDQDPGPGRHLQGGGRPDGLAPDP